MGLPLHLTQLITEVQPASALLLVWCHRSDILLRMDNEQPLTLPLHSHSRLTQVVRVLLAAGADVDLPWAGGPLAGAPPLYSAASGGRVELLRLLIGARAASAFLMISARASCQRCRILCTDASKTKGL